MILRSTLAFLALAALAAGCTGTNTVGSQSTSSGGSSAGNCGTGGAACGAGQACNLCDIECPAGCCCCGCHAETASSSTGSGAASSGGSTAAASSASAGSSTGSTTGGTGCGSVTVSPPELDFGDVVVGSFTGLDAVTFQNGTCSTVWLTVNDSALDSQFGINDANGTSPVDHPDSIAAGTSYTVEVFYAPTVLGTTTSTFSWSICPTQADALAGTNCTIQAAPYTVTGTGVGASTSGGSTGGSTGGGSTGGGCGAGAEVCGPNESCNLCGIECSPGCCCCGCSPSGTSGGSTGGAGAGFTCGLPPNTGTVSCSGGQFCEFECYYNFPTCYDPPAACGPNPSCACILDAGTLCTTIVGAQPNPPTCVEDGGIANVFCSQSC